MRRPNSASTGSITVEKVAVNAVMAGARPEYFPVILALAATRRQRARQHHQLDGRDGGGQRPDPPRDRHERGHRRAGPVQPRQRHHRPRLRPAVAEPAGRLGARATPTWARRATTTPTTASPSPRTRSAAPGSRSTCSTASSPSESVVSVFTGCRSTAFTLGLREKHWREHVRNLLRGMDPHSPPTLLLDPITARQFIDRGGFDTKEKLIELGLRERRACRPASTGTTSSSRTTSTRALRSARSPMPPSSRRRRTS